eukprot:COSAG01_NODE_30612_length_612_cov_257.452242_1_plen_164_part_01
MTYSDNLHWHPSTAIGLPTQTIRNRVWPKGIRVGIRAVVDGDLSAAGNHFGRDNFDFTRGVIKLSDCIGIARVIDKTRSVAFVRCIDRLDIKAPDCVFILTAISRTAAAPRGCAACVSVNKNGHAVHTSPSVPSRMICNTLTRKVKGTIANVTQQNWLAILHGF